MREDFDDIEDYYAECVAINEHDLDSEYKRVAADLSFWNARYADAVEAHGNAKREYEETKARASIEIRETAAGRGDKVTNPEVDAKVLLDPDVQDTHILLISAEANLKRARGRVDAIVTKKEMLQSLGAKLRLEMAHDPAVREAVAGQRLTGY